MADLADQWPAELRQLLGAPAHDLLDAVAGAAGGDLEAWAPRQVTHQPQRSTVVRYAADVAWPDGRTSTETFVAATGERLPPGAATFDDGTTQVAVWRWPHDPSLPALADALDARRIGRVLDDLGAGGGPVELRVRAYRPGRRAVIEATGSGGRVYGKVVRPHRVEALHALHRHLSTHLPVPDSLGWTDDGLLVLPGLPGRTLRSALADGDPVPPPVALVSLLDRLPVDLADGARRAGPLDAAEGHGRTIAAVLPTAGPRLEELLGRLAHHAAAAPIHDVVPVHGDLHDAQLLVLGGDVTGLLDVDTAGGGHRIDDLANLCGHLAVVTSLWPAAGLLAGYRDAVVAEAERRHDRVDLRTRVAAVVLGLATGPFRAQEPGWVAATAQRLALAEAWLAGDRAVAGAR